MDGIFVSLRVAARRLGCSCIHHNYQVLSQLNHNFCKWVLISSQISSFAALPCRIGPGQSHVHNRTVR